MANVLAFVTPMASGLVVVLADSLQQVFPHRAVSGGWVAGGWLEFLLALSPRPQSVDVNYGYLASARPPSRR